MKMLNSSFERPIQVLEQVLTLQTHRLVVRMRMRVSYPGLYFLSAGFIPQGRENSKAGLCQLILVIVKSI